MTSLETITYDEILKLTPNSFFEMLNWQGADISIKTLEKFINSASNDVQETKEFEFFSGFLYGRLVSDFEISGGCAPEPPCPSVDN